MAVTWTADQKKVIDTRQKNILVSAAAGSGKTAVLVARILALVMDKEHPVDIDELLVVTFTRAAAEEMRARIRTALEKERKKDPSNRHLLRQLTLVHTAQITTIDSFCMQVVKNHFQEADRDPAFRVGEDGELKLLMQDVVEEILEEAYEEGSREFLDFADCYASGKTDKTLESLILRLYQFAESYPWPQEWLKWCEDTAGGKALGAGEAPAWIKELMDSVCASIYTFANYGEAALRVCQDAEGPYMYEEAIRSDLKQMMRMTHAETYEELFEAVQAYEPKRLSSAKDNSVSEHNREYVKSIRDEYKKGLDDLKKRFFSGNRNELFQNMVKAGTAERCLISLTQKFYDRYEQKKRERNLVDFSDLEHDALKIFLKDENGRKVRTDIANSYAKRFKEIFIDEYQDSNLVQEILLNSISGEPQGRHNLFMVGDVKQSIYSFRLARPELFIDKYHRYGKKEEGCLRIDLKQNFRSRTEVLSSVNYIFEQIMQEDLGAVMYDEAAALYPGADYPKCDMKQELLLLENTPEGPEDYGISKQLEAKMCADRIRDLVTCEWITDRETGELRPVRYSDIVILLRAMDGWVEVFQEVFSQEGIPCRAMMRSGYFTSYEIQTMLNMLRIIDNPRQDIPLTAVLKSAIGGFHEEELALIRSLDSSGYFYEACERYCLEASEGRLRQKLEQFYQMLERFREMVPYTSIHELIWKILDETGFEAYALAMPGGKVRQANLAMLADKALAFERTSYKGVFHFVRYMDRMIRYQVDYGEADGSGERPDAVEIQSIHKSKGLEYPVVFVAGMGKGFNEMDMRNAIVVHMDHGIGIDYVDPVERIRKPSLKKRAIQRELRKSMLGEELRVLYVAMTRAKEKLILTGTVRSLQKELMKWHKESLISLETISYETRYSAKNYLDLIMPALLKNKCAEELLEEYDLKIPEYHECYDREISMEIRTVTAEDLVWKRTGQEMNRWSMLERWKNKIEKEEKAAFSPLWEAVYPWSSYEDLPVKLSVSELKHQQNKMEDEDGTLLYEEADVMPLVPKFMEQKQEAAGSVRGDAYHHLMELLDFSIDPAAESVHEAIQNLIGSERYTADEYDLLDETDVVRFLQSPLGIRMSAASKRGGLYKEQPFVIGIPAEEVQETYKGSGEQILIQGIIDAFFYEDGDIVLMDYKTDRLYKESAFVDRYRVQLEYYQKALEQLTGKKVKEIYIYSFTLGREIQL